jgi:hypothetical protein
MPEKQKKDNDRDWDTEQPEKNGHFVPPLVRAQGKWDPFCTATNATAGGRLDHNVLYRRHTVADTQPPTTERLLMAGLLPAPSHPLRSLSRRGSAGSPLRIWVDDWRTGIGLIRVACPTRKATAGTGGALRGAGWAATPCQNNLNRLYCT